MYLFDVNDTTQVNLLNLDSVKLLNGKFGKSLSVVINGQVYPVEERRHKDLIKILDNLQKGFGLTQQYYAL